MNSKVNLLLPALLGGTICVLLCASCATEKWGVYEVVHRERFQDGYEAILLKSDDSLRFDVEYKGQPFCEVEVDSDGTRAVVSPYLSDHPEDHATLFYRDGKMTGVRSMTQGDETVMLFDHDGDGYPEKRATLDADGVRIIEELSPQVVSSRRKGETPPKEGDAPQAESPERMILNVSLSMHSLDFFNRLALEHPFFERRMTVKLLDAPMADLNDIIAEQAGISVHAIDGAGRKSISITATERSLRSILLELAETHGFLYEPALSPEGDVIMLFMYNVDPMLRGIGDSQGPELEGDQGDSPL